LTVWCGFAWTVPLSAQQALITPEVPDRFKLDMETAARLRPQLLSQSMEPSNRYEIGRNAFLKLVAQARPPRGSQLSWELRIANDDLLNAYSSPDGTIYIDRNLAQLAGPSAGLWAAILSHEIAHVVRRDWARRYLYEKSLKGSGSAALVLGDPGMPSGDWTDSRKASEDLARFCRQLELDADLEGLMLMARAGYHPDFVPALHHLLHALGTGTTTSSIYAMHPCWETRDRELDRAYSTASIQFDRLWPEWFASPGGNPPIVVFAEEPTVRKTSSKAWEIQVPMRCQNLVGAVEVVLLTRPTQDEVTATVQQLPEASQEVRQLTGCTSPKTTITFAFTDGSGKINTSGLTTDVYVLDAQGAVLSRAEVPKLRR
jgi:hypothetical protein